MRSVIPALLLAGCAITPEKFANDFVPLYCEAWADCNSSGRPCPVTLEGASFDSPDCDFDKDAARDCLAADYTCDDAVPQFEVVVTPESCNSERICGI